MEINNQNGGNKETVQEMVTP